MSDEIIYTNSQVEQLKNETNDQVSVLKSQIKNYKLITETLKVRDVKYFNSIQFWKIKIAYHIEGHASDFAEGVYAYPVIYNTKIGTGGENGFYVMVPLRGGGIVALEDDDILKVDYMVLDPLE